MIKRNNMRMTALSMALGLALLTGCGSKAATQSVAESGTNSAESQTLSTETEVSSNIEVSYKENDYYTDWNTGEATQITLNGDSISAEGNGVEVNGSTVTVNSGGTYVISGSLSDGQIIVDSQDENAVRLVLNGVEIHSETGSPIYVKQAKKAVVSLEAGTTNKLSDSNAYVLEEGTDEPDAVIFSKDDLTINGTGTLIIEANYNNAITSKDKLKIMEGSIIIDAEGDGIKGKDMVAVKDGNITINAKEDGLKATNSTEAGKGFVYIEGGSINITSGNDGIQAETDIKVLGGSFNLNTGGGSSNGTVHAEESFGGKGGFGMTRPADAGMTKPANEGMTAPADAGTTAPADAGTTAPADAGTTAPADAGTTAPANEGMTAPADAGTTAPANEGMTAPADAGTTAPADAGTTAPADAGTATSAEDTASDSFKGLKAVNRITVEGGTFNIDSADDALHSNNEVIINNGEFSIASGDDGIHADTLLKINGGTINITKSYEGLEASEITVAGGETYVTSTDDGVNATDGSAAMSMSPGSSSNNVKLTVSGGYLNVDASGDGLDANGSLYMTDGTVIVNGPTSGGNGALDYDAVCEISGGTLIVSGSAQMAQTVSSSAAQKAVSITFNTGQEAGSSIALLDEAGNVVVCFVPDKSYQAVTISSPLLEEGKTYTFSYGGTVTGEAADGLYQSGSYSGGTKVTDFTITDEITYLNESGVTTGGAGFSGGMQGGRGGRGSRPADNTAAPADNQASAS